MTVLVLVSALPALRLSAMRLPATLWLSAAVLRHRTLLRLWRVVRLGCSCRIRVRRIISVFLRLGCVVHLGCARCIRMRRIVGVFLRSVSAVPLARVVDLARACAR